MSAIKEIDSLPSHRVLGWAFIIGSFIGTPALFLFVFFRKLFEDLLVFKLVILSFSIALPVFLVFFLFTAADEPKNKQDDSEGWSSIFEAGVLSTAFFLFFIVVGYLFHLNVQFIIFFMLFSLLCFLSGVIVFTGEQKEGNFINYVLKGTIISIACVLLLLFLRDLAKNHLFKAMLVVLFISLVFGFLWAIVLIIKRKVLNSKDSSSIKNK